jgi:GTPase involved in cell partitioning and DNA repair
LAHIARRQIAKNGQGGQGGGSDGKNGDDIILLVPQGTIVRELVRFFFVFVFVFVFGFFKNILYILLLF